MEIKVKGLCVRSIDYRDNDSLITLATLEKGKITAIVKGSKKQTSKLRFSSSLFCFGEYILTISKSGRYTVTSCDLIDGFIKLREDIDKFYMSSVILEILEKNLVVPNDKLILMALKGLKAICYSEQDDLISLISFVYNSIILTGYSLPKVCCATCRRTDDLYFDKTDLNFVCRAHKINKGVLLSSGEVSGLTYVYNGESEKLKEMPQNIRQNVLYILITYFELLTEQNFKTYQSYLQLLKSF